MHPERLLGGIDVIQKENILLGNAMMGGTSRLIHIYSIGSSAANSPRAGAPSSSSPS